MEIKILLKSNLKSHRGTVLGVFALILLVFLSLGAVLTVWNNSSRYVDSEMNRLGYGDITAWVSGLQDTTPLAEEVSALDEVESVGVQSLIFSEYEIGDQESDSEGQLITYDPGHYPYKFFTEDLSGYQAAPAEIAPGEVYVSASMVSMFGIQIGDTITFPIARSGGDVIFTVAGFYEDPFMGSSMIGMKGFLICEQDHEEIAEVIEESGVDSLAREGFMLHISKVSGSTLTAAQFNAFLNENTSLTSYVEFTHSKDAIAGFMLTLQNVFTSLLLAFVVILLFGVHGGALPQHRQHHRTGLYQYGNPQNHGIHQRETTGNPAFAISDYHFVRYGIGAASFYPGSRVYLPDDSDYYGIADPVCIAHRNLLTRFGSHSSPADGLRLAPHRENPPDFSRERHPGNLEEIPGKQKGSFPHSKEMPFFLAGDAAASLRETALYRGLSRGSAACVLCLSHWPGKCLVGAKRRRLDGRIQSCGSAYCRPAYGRNHHRAGGADHRELHIYYRFL